jgi:hypothetical protein
VYGGGCGTKILVIPIVGRGSGFGAAALKVAYPGDGSSPFHIPGPAGAEFILRANWAFFELFASDDGSLLALIDWKVYRWIDGKWSAEPGSRAPRFSVCTRPVPGWEVFLDLRDTLNETLKGESAART